jgi:hypothetical protein
MSFPHRRKHYQRHFSGVIIYVAYAHVRLNLKLKMNEASEEIEPIIIQC